MQGRSGILRERALWRPVRLIVETARIACDRIVPIRAGQAFVLRGISIPLVHLADLLKIEVHGNSSPLLNIVIVKVGAHRVAVAVDAILEPRE